MHGLKLITIPKLTTGRGWGGGTLERDIIEIEALTGVLVKS